MLDLDVAGFCWTLFSDEVLPVPFCEGLDSSCLDLLGSCCCCDDAFGDDELFRTGEEKLVERGLVVALVDAKEGVSRRADEVKESSAFNIERFI